MKVFDALVNYVRRAVKFIETGIIKEVRLHDKGDNYSNDRDLLLRDHLYNYSYKAQVVLPQVGGAELDVNDRTGEVTNVNWIPGFDERHGYGFFIGEKKEERKVEVLVALHGDLSRAYSVGQIYTNYHPPPVTKKFDFGYIHRSGACIHFNDRYLSPTEGHQCQGGTYHESSGGEIQDFDPEVNGNLLQVANRHVVLIGKKFLDFGKKRNLEDEASFKPDELCECYPDENWFKVLHQTGATFEIDRHGDSMHLSKRIFLIAGEERLNQRTNTRTQDLKDNEILILAGKEYQKGGQLHIDEDSNMGGIGRGIRFEVGETYLKDDPIEIDPLIWKVQHESLTYEEIDEKGNFTEFINMDAYYKEQHACGSFIYMDKNAIVYFEKSGIHITLSDGSKIQIIPTNKQEQIGNQHSISVGNRFSIIVGNGKSGIIMDGDVVTICANGEINLNAPVIKKCGDIIHDEPSCGCGE